MNLKLKQKIVILVLLAALIPIGTAFVRSFMIREQISQKVLEQMRALSEQD
jgi:hypothetical protein